jgi:hypothetical protein
MEIDKLMTYQEVVASLDKKHCNKHLLFGNGFSIAYDRTIFSYIALRNFIETTGDPHIRSLFQKLNTKIFELIMQQLDNFCEIAEIFSDDKTLVPKIKATSETLKNNLIEAIKELHPEHVFKVSEEKSQLYIKFLQDFINKNGLVFPPITTYYFIWF